MPTTPATPAAPAAMPVTPAIADVLVIFESKYGQTAKIAEHVAELARKRGLSARVLSIDAARQANGMTSGQTFIIVAPVYFGQHPRAIRRFVRRHADWISAHPCAFISVCNAAADERVAAQSQAYRYAAAFMSATGLRPSVYLSVAGAVAYPRYGFFVRTMMRMLSGPKRARHGDSNSNNSSSNSNSNSNSNSHSKVDLDRVLRDRTQIHELTDWSSIDYAMSRFFSDAEAGTTINTVRKKQGAESLAANGIPEGSASTAPRGARLARQRLKSLLEAVVPV